LKVADAGDTATITYSEQLNASTIWSTWSNSGVQTLANATVTITNNNKDDRLTLTTPSGTFNFGTMVIGDYVSATTTFTSSTATWSPTARTLTITLGTMASGTLKTNVGTAKQEYTPISALTDLAGNAMAATQFTDGIASGF